MNIILKSFLLSCFFVTSIFAQSQNRFITLGENTLDQTLMNDHSQIAQHTMDVMLSSDQKEILLNSNKNVKKIDSVSIVIVKTNDTYKGEVRIFNKSKNGYDAIVAFNFTNKSDVIYQVRRAVTEALLGKEFAHTHADEIRRKSKEKLNTIFLSGPTVKIANQNTILLSENSNPESQIKKLLKQNDNDILKKEFDRKNEVSKIVNNSVMPADGGILPSSPEKVEMPKERPDARPPTPLSPAYTNRINLIADFKKQAIQTNNQLKVDSNLLFVEIGANIYVKDSTPAHPNVLFAQIKIEDAVNKASYKIPFTKVFELAWNKLNYYSFLDLSLGATLDPIYFVDLPLYGGGLKLIKNNIVWIYTGFNVSDMKNIHPLLSNTTMQFKLYKSLFSNSNHENKKIDAWKFGTDANYRVINSLSIFVGYDFMNGKTKDGGKIAGQVLGAGLSYSIL